MSKVLSEVHILIAEPWACTLVNVTDYLNLGCRSSLLKNPANKTIRLKTTGTIKNSIRQHPAHTPGSLKRLEVCILEDGCRVVLVLPKVNEIERGRNCKIAVIERGQSELVT